MIFIGFCHGISSWVFSLNIEQATEVMLKVHYGRSYFRHIQCWNSRNKVAQVKDVLKENEHPLLCTVWSKYKLLEQHCCSLRRILMLNKLESSLNGALLVLDKRHEFMTVEHLLLALLENDATEKRSSLSGTISMLFVMSSIFYWSKPSLIENLMKLETQPTLSFNEYFNARFSCQSSGRSEVTGANVLVAILSWAKSRGIPTEKRHQSCFRHH